MAHNKKIYPKVNEAELGKKAFARGDYSTAYNYYDQWLAKYPQSPGVLVERGRTQKQLKKFAEALEDFNKAIAVDPKDLRAKVYQCDVLILLGRQKEVRMTLNSILENPRFSKMNAYEKYWAHYLDCKLHHSAKNYYKALDAAQKGIKVYELYPHVFKAQGTPYIKRFVLYYHALCSFELSDFSQAAEDMEAYISLAKQAGEKIGSGDYKDLAIYYYLAAKIDKCKAVLPHMNKKDRQDLVKGFGDSSLE